MFSSIEHTLTGILILTTLVLSIGGENSNYTDIDCGIKYLDAEYTQIKNK